MLARIKASWTSWRGRAIEPIVRESLARLLPLDGLAAEAVGGYWTRTNVPEVDIIGADRNPLAKVITFAGSIKWLETEPFDNGDLNALAAATLQVPGASKDTPLIAVSRSGVGPNVNAAFKFGPNDLIKAW